MLKKYASCFIGAEAVTWLAHNEPGVKDRAAAVELGVELQMAGLLSHVTRVRRAGVAVCWGETRSAFFLSPQSDLLLLQGPQLQGRAALLPVHRGRCARQHRAQTLVGIDRSRVWRRRH